MAVPYIFATTAAGNVPASQLDTNFAYLLSTVTGYIPPPNFLPNCQWQLWSALNYITKQNEAGTAAQTAVSCSAFSTTNNTPTFTAANTQALRVGDLVVISGGGYQWGYAGSGYVSTATANRVAAVTANTSFVVAASPLGGVSPVLSAAVTATPITPGDAGTGTGQAADGWKKSTSATVWADDWTANACPGAIRTLGYRKGAAGAQTLSWTVSPNQIGRYKGVAVTFGVLVYQKVQSGAGTWRAYVSDDVTGTSYSTSGTGSSYSVATYAGFQFLSVTATISATATTCSMGVSFDGANSDVYYVALPTGVFGSNLSVTGCRQNPNDVMRSVVHWNPPLLTPLAMDFPAVAYPGTGGLLYGFSGQDLEAMSLGQVHKSVTAVKCKIELITSTVGGNFFTGSALDYSLIFGPQVVTQISGTINVDSGWLPLAEDGTCAFFVASSSLTITNATFDFDMVQLSMAGAATS